MCAHFESVKDPKRLKAKFKVDMPAKVNFDVWPTYSSTFIRVAKTTPNLEASEQAKDSITGSVQQLQLEAMVGSFGLIPHWSKDTKIARHTYNARVETVTDKPAFKDAWRLGRLCIIPAESIYEPDWRSGKAQSTKIQRADHEPMGIAGIWTGWKSPSGEVIRSFSMLTINADDHAFMKNFHKPGEEKRMVVILDETNYETWLYASTEKCLELIQPFPADRLVATTHQHNPSH